MERCNTTMATTEAENKALTSRVHSDLIEGGNVDLVEELYAEDAVIHGAPSGDLRGRDEIRAHFESLLSALSPRDVTEDLVVCEGDLVTIRRTDTYTHDGEVFGSEPTGENVTFTSHVIARVENGEIAEVWLASPMYDLLVQLDVVEPPTG